MILRVNPVGKIFPILDSTKEHPDRRRLNRIIQYQSTIQSSGDTLEISEEGRRLAEKYFS